MARIGNVSAQDTNLPKTPKPEAPTPPPQVSSPSSFSGDVAEPAPVPVNPSPKSNSYTGENRRFPARDTLPPKYIANPTPLVIVPWDKTSTENVNLDSTSQIFKPVNSGGSADALAVLDTWKENAIVRYVPFQLEENKTVSLALYFSFPQNLAADSKIFLCMEGVGWRSEVKLNGKFLGIHEMPFAAWTIPLNMAWLRAEDNYLEISLSIEAHMLPFSPRPFLGIFRPAYIVTEAQLRKLQATNLPAVAATQDTVAIYAPYYYEKGYVFDKMEAVKVLTHAKRNGISHLYFLFPPDASLQKLCTEMEFTQVLKLQTKQKVAWLNAYPYHAAGFPFPAHFWLNEKAYRTTDYGEIFDYTMKEVYPVHHRISIFYAFCVFFPLFGMFLIKILNPGFFYALADVLLRPRLTIDKFMEATAGNRGLLLVLQAVRVGIVSISLALLAEYLQTNNQWHKLTSFSDTGLIFYLFGEKTPFVFNMLKSLLIVGAWALFRMLFIRALSSLFRIINMYEGMINLELIGAYPLLFVLPLPLILLPHAAPHYHAILWMLEGVLLMAYLLRQIYICYVGMDKLFDFSMSVKLLYIMAGIILPYLISL